MKRTVFFVSDGTGITAETLGHSLITQFEYVAFEQITLPYIDSIKKAQLAVRSIEEAGQSDQQPPLVFATLVNPEIRDIIAQCSAVFMDFFRHFIGPLETELQSQSSYTIGRSHGVHDDDSYKTRIDAINYTLGTDDGVNVHQYESADLILIGVSRCGKTPTCLYLALQYGIRAANYPITEEDMETSQLPKHLLEFRNKLFGLTIEPMRLQAIRSERRPESRYASMAQCQKELRNVESLYLRNQIAYLNTSSLSIEEIATKILAQMGLKRRLL